MVGLGRYLRTVCPGSPSGDAYVALPKDRRECLFGREFESDCKIDSDATPSPLLLINRSETNSPRRFCRAGSVCRPSNTPGSPALILPSRETPRVGLPFIRIEQAKPQTTRPPAMPAALCYPHPNAGLGQAISGVRTDRCQCDRGSILPTWKTAKILRVDRGDQPLCWSLSFWRPIGRGCLLLEVKRTSPRHCGMSAFDPNGHAEGPFGV